MKTKIEVLRKDAILDMLTVSGFLDNKRLEISEEDIKNGSEYGPDLSYEILNDSTIQYEYGWSDFEECDNDTVVIKFLEDGIRVSKLNIGYSVYCEHYENSDVQTFKTMPELIVWLNNNL